MLKLFRQKWISRFVAFLLAVHIFNICIDPPDTDPDKPEDLTVNEIESIAEFVLEDILHIENAFEEHDEPGEVDGYSFDLKKEFAFHEFTSISFSTQYNYATLIKPAYNINYNSIVPKISSPPPRS